MTVTVARIWPNAYKEGLFYRRSNRWDRLTGKITYLNRKAIYIQYDSGILCKIFPKDYLGSLKTISLLDQLGMDGQIQKEMADFVQIGWYYIQCCGSTR